MMSNRQRHETSVKRKVARMEVDQGLTIAIHTTGVGTRAI